MVSKKNVHNQYSAFKFVAKICIQHTVLKEDEQQKLNIMHVKISRVAWIRFFGQAKFTYKLELQDGEAD